MVSMAHNGTVQWIIKLAGDWAGVDVVLSRIGGGALEAVLDATQCKCYSWFQ